MPQCDTKVRPKQTVQRRRRVHLKIHEYQAKELMKARGIAVPEGKVATTVAEAVAAVRPLTQATGNKCESCP